MVEQLKSWQAIESVKFDLLVLPEDFILNDNVVVEANVLVECLKSNSLTQADIDRNYEDFSDLIYSEVLLSIPHYNVKKSVNKMWWKA